MSVLALGGIAGALGGFLTKIPDYFMNLINIIVSILRKLFELALSDPKIALTLILLTAYILTD